MSSRRCGFCKQPGHDRRTCPAYKSTEQLCKSTLTNDRGSFTRNVGWNNECTCDNCETYRRFNFPTPEIACQIIKDQELAEELEEKENQFPYIGITNETRSPIYVYRNDALQRLKKTIEPSEQFTIKYELPFDKDEVDNYTITDHDYGDLINYNEIEPEHILKLLTIQNWVG